jgi:hypothetical protein
MAHAFRPLLVLAVLSLGCAGRGRASADVEDPSPRERTRARHDDAPPAPPLELSEFHWGRRATAFYACMLRATDDKQWRRTTKRTESWMTDDFAARVTGHPDEGALVHINASDNGGVHVQVAATADTCGLLLAYSRSGVHSVLLTDERSTCRLDFAVTGQSYWVDESALEIDVDGTEEDLDAFLAGGEVLRRAIEQDLAQLFATTVTAIAEGHLQRLSGHDGCVPVFEPFTVAQRRTLLAKIQREVARRRAAMDEMIRVRDRALAEIPCLALLTEPASVTEIAMTELPALAAYR